MKRLKIALVFISFYLVRLWFGSGLELVEGQRVKLTIPTVDFAEYSDSQTIVRRGKWEVRIDGYTEFIPGDVIVVEGIWDGRKVVGEKISNGSNNLLVQAGYIDKLLIGISYVRRWAVEQLQRNIPEPMASLASGILLGVKARMPYEFYQELVKTGTLHIIAASGFNVMIVATLLIGLLGRVLPKNMAIMGGVLGIIFYVILAGGSASVVRAGIMGSLTLIAFYFGRAAEAKRLLWVTAGVMLLADPAMLGDIGFQLSMTATMGLLYVGPWISNIKLSNWKLKWVNDLLIPTLVATIATAPVIWWHFGRLSLIGVLVNILILPLVPMIMLFSAITLVITPVSYLLYAPLWWLVTVIEWFG